MAMKGTITAAAIAALLLGGSVTLTLGGCSGDHAESGGASGAAPGSAPDVASGGRYADTSVALYSFRGKVVAVDAGRRAVTIDHEKIGDFMEPMTMPFKVADTTLLSRAVPGRAMAFTIRVAHNTIVLTDVRDTSSGS